jgi:hypothetical protein
MLKEVWGKMCWNKTLFLNELSVKDREEAIPRRQLPRYSNSPVVLKENPYMLMLLPFNYFKTEIDLNNN